jgi:hypothetical protein
MLSNGEYVVKADSVKKYGVGFMDSINSAKFADGGSVGARPLMSINSRARYGADLMGIVNSGVMSPTFVNPQSIRNIASSPAEIANNSTVHNIEYNVNVSVAGSNSTPEEIAKVVINTIKQKEKANSANRRIG